MGASETPSTSVIVPFLGELAEAQEALQALGALALGPNDELVIVDNSAEGVLEGLDGVRVVHAPHQRSAYYARNVGAQNTSGEWMLFLDGDCRPVPELLERYHDLPIEQDCGAIAGAVVGDPDQAGLIPRYARSRRHLDQEEQFRHPHRPAAVTANLLVRRRTLESVGGFLEGIRSGGDTDFCWRMQDAGWSLAYAPEAVARHLHRDSVGALARQAVRDGAGRAWVNRRHQGALGRPAPGRGLARCVGGAAVWALRGQTGRSVFKLIDAVVIASSTAGYLGGNAARLSPPSPPAIPDGMGITVFADIFPVLSETFVSEEVRALSRAGHRVRVEATVRPARPSPSSARGIAVHYTEDEGIASRLADLCRLVARHPRRTMEDLRSRSRWRREEDVKPLRALAPRVRRLRHSGERHLHVHFAGHSALDAMRLADLLELPYSVTAHAHDIFHVPANLKEKLERAAFVSTGCDYNVRYLRGLLEPDAGERVHEIVMGVNAGQFKRRSEYPGGRTVVAIGRLVEQKGFRYLIEAAAHIEKGSGLDRLAIIGAGPLEDSLRELALQLGVDGKLDVRGARDPTEVRELLEQADLLAMPCIVTADGNRDSMPVVVKEALAMEVPVVGTDEVGLPELVRSGWGRLVPPADSVALAAAIEELLALPVDERRRMGRAGREWVKRNCNTDTEARKLADLIRSAGAA